jgi:hypothetical protein
MEVLDDKLDNGTGDMVPDDGPASEDRLGVCCRLRDPEAFCEARDSARACSLPGGSGAFRNRLAMPDEMIPG